MMSPVQKRAVFKLAVDLAKADKQIHGNEVALLSSLQGELGLGREELDMVHYMSLQEALTALRPLGEEDRNAVVRTLETMVGVDVDVDRREQVLFGSIKMVLSGESSSWVDVVSVNGSDAECTSEQIVYLEKSRCDSARGVLDDRFENLLISKALNDVGLQMFYLPQIKQRIDVGLLQRSMSYILPSSELADPEDIKDSLSKTSSVAFFNAFCSAYRISPGQVGFDAFLALKIQEGEILNDEGRLSRSMDFLCIDVTSELKKRITHFVTQIEAPDSTLSYDGYYRLLYDHLSTATSTVSSVLIDSRFDFYLKDLGDQKLKFESAAQAKTLYLLFLRYGVRGISQDTFDKAEEQLEAYRTSALAEDWDFCTYCNSLMAENTDHSRLIYNLLMIYRAVSTKDHTDVSFLNYISTIIRQRSALKNYINHGFASATHLKEKDSYCISYDKNAKAYCLAADVSLFFIEESGSASVRIKDSALWKSLSI